MTDRRDFLRLLGAAALAGCAPRGAPPLPPGEWLGLDLTRGHRLRTLRGRPAPDSQRKVAVLIVGGGISGLSAAWRLARAGADDFLLLELETSPGGNSRAGQSPSGAYPWGAHYLPLPGPGATLVRELLAETGVLLGDAGARAPMYDERYLCAAPQERVFRHGLWDEGLLPQRGLDEAEHGQQQRFHERMAALKRLRGRDGRRVFALPMALSSGDPAWRALDRIDFRQWLLDEGFTAPTVHWLANYACRDDYGCDYAQTSAWAGLHYFACRDGEAANSSSDAVLTAPEGNAWLMRALLRHAEGRVMSDAMAWRIEEGKHALTVDVLHGERALRIAAGQVIWAAPLHLLPRVWGGLPGPLGAFAGAGDYAPWLVANLHLSAPPEERHGAPPAWDNVLYEGPGLGYVNAAHQLIRRHAGGTVFTYYRALSDLPPTEGRRRLLELPREVWAAGVLDELSRVHPDLRERTVRLDLLRYGHAMRCPRPGSLFHGQREKLADFSHSRLALAHADLSGFSIFEEAQYRGVRAAEKVLRRGSSAGA